ncbi:MAG: glycerate kinase, partial [Firmicutes bacterium]|nr:glycerate kinase [Bacillota bacterium]
MEIRKIKNFEELISHGASEARSRVLELTDRTLEKLDAYKELTALMHLEGNELVIGKRRLDISGYRRIYAFSSGKAGNHLARA